MIKAFEGNESYIVTLSFGWQLGFSFVRLRHGDALMAGERESLQS